MTRLSGFEELSGEDWQALCIRVLHEYHPGPELIEVPDDDRGDAGLEAFSLTGCAYQCYAPEGEPLTLNERYRKQRIKITDDVAKFINNADKIKMLLPPALKISRWVLLVPYINTRRILEHCSTKTTLIRSANLSYADPNITVVAQTLDAFEGAKEAVVRRQLTKLALPPIPSIDFSAINDDLIGRMNSKLSMTTRFSDGERRRTTINRFLNSYIAGRVHRDHIRDHYSELGDQLETRLDDLEDRLVMQYALDEPVPDRRLVTILRDTEKTVQEVLNTREDHSRVIAEGQVADWLLRCPLDFV